MQTDQSGSLLLSKRFCLTILYHFPGEDVLVEVVLDLFVRDVDAQLLERILLEILKAEDVEQTNGKSVAAEMKRNIATGIKKRST